jgi:hypothetical protein
MVVEQAVVGCFGRYLTLINMDYRLDGRRDSRVELKSVTLIKPTDSSVPGRIAQG